MAEWSTDQILTVELGNCAYIERALPETTAERADLREGKSAILDGILCEGALPDYAGEQVIRENGTLSVGGYYCAEDLTIAVEAPAALTYMQRAIGYARHMTSGTAETTCTAYLTVPEGAEILGVCAGWAKSNGTSTSYNAGTWPQVLSMKDPRSAAPDPGEVYLRSGNIFSYSFTDTLAYGKITAELLVFWRLPGIQAERQEDGNYKLTADDTVSELWGNEAQGNGCSLGGGAMHVSSVDLSRSTITKIPPYAFYGQDALTELLLPQGVTEYGEGALYGTKLPLEKISAWVVGTSALGGNDAITHMEFDAAVLPASCFAKDANLTKVWLRESVRSCAAATAASSPFLGCSEALTIYCEADTVPGSLGSYWALTGAEGTVAATVICGQKTCPW